MKRAPRSRQRHDLYAKYHDYDSEISDLLGECGMMAFGASRACKLYLPSGNISETNFVLVGNSHAQMYAPLFRTELTSKKINSILVPLNGCLPTVSVNISVECGRAARENLDNILDLPNLSTVIVAFNWPVNVPLMDEKGRLISDAADQALAAGVDDLIVKLRQAGKKVVLVGPIAIPGFDIASVLSRQVAFGRSEKSDDATSAPAFLRAHADILARFSQRSDVLFLQPHKIQCDDQACHFMIDGTMLFADSNHLAVDALPIFAPMLKPMNEILEPAPR